MFYFEIHQKKKDSTSEKENKRDKQIISFIKKLKKKTEASWK